MPRRSTLPILFAACAALLTACAAPDAAPRPTRTFGHGLAGVLEGSTAVDANSAAVTVAEVGSGETAPPAATSGSSTDAAAIPAAEVAATPPAEAVDASVGQGVLGERAPGEARPAPVDASATKPVDDRVRERQLRTAFAEATDVLQPALELAGFLSQRERVDEACYVVEQAMQRGRAPELRIAHAGLLRDLADCRGAARELQTLRQELGDAALSAGTLFELAQVEFLAGERENARTTLRSLQQGFRDDPWMGEHGDAVVELEQAIAADKPQNAMGVRDLLALLRSAPQVTSRLQLLTRIATTTGAATDEERLPLRLRAIAIAGGDDSPAVRARAVQLAADNAIVAPDYWSAALGDADALPRRMAAKASVAALGRAAAPLLLAALEVEADAAVAAALHRALADALAEQAPGGCDLATAEGRADACAHWRARCR